MMVQKKSRYLSPSIKSSLSSSSGVPSNSICPFLPGIMEKERVVLVEKLDKDNRIKIILTPRINLDQSVYFLFF